MSSSAARVVWAVHAVLTVSVLLGVASSIQLSSGRAGVFAVAALLSVLIEGTYAPIAFGLTKRRRATKGAALHLLAFVVLCAVMAVWGVAITDPFALYWSTGLVAPLIWESAVFVRSGFERSQMPT